jgi:hypothetical protein
MENYLEFFAQNFDTQEVQEAKSRGVTSKESTTSEKHKPNPNLHGSWIFRGFRDRWIDPDGSTLDPTVREANQLNQTGPKAYIKAW